MVYKKPYNFQKSTYRFRKAGNKSLFQKKSGYYPKLIQMEKDVKSLKGIVNAEAKDFVLQVGQDPVEIGQFNGASTAGFYAFDITPIPAQGVTSITRNGDSIKLKDVRLRFQFYSMSATQSPIKIRIIILKVKDIGETATVSATNFLSDTPWSNANIIDYNSIPDSDFERAYTKIFDKRITFPAQLYNTQKMVLNKIYYNNFSNHHVRYNADGTTPNSGRLAMIVLCDNGNCSTTTATTATGAPVTAVNTGLEMNWETFYRFYDN